jgi:hypothetical protein
VTALEGALKRSFIPVHRGLPRARISLDFGTRACGLMFATLARGFFHLEGALLQ